MTRVRYMRDRDGLVHALRWRSAWSGPEDNSSWEWPMGHTDARVRDATECGEAPVTCFVCVAGPPPLRWK